jgi:hypothetical protein
MSDVLGMTATEFVLFQENARLKAENKYLKEHAGPENIFSAASEPQVMKMRSCAQQLNVAVRTYCRDDGYGYHVIGQAHSGLHVAYYVDRLALARLSDWALGDMLKQQLEQVTRALVAALTEKGMPTLAYNLDESPQSTSSEKP